MGMSITAEEAKKLTDDSLRGPAVEKYLNHIDARIVSFAKLGKNSIHNPQVGFAFDGMEFYLNQNERKAVRIHYEKNGFTWTDHPDPDPGHPCGGPYTTLEW